MSTTFKSEARCGQLPECLIEEIITEIEDEKVKSMIETEPDSLKGDDDTIGE